MNELLKGYMVDVQYPDVSGIEQHYMLFVRDQLALIKNQLTGEEQAILADADRQLSENAALFLPELSRFIDLADERSKKAIPPERWWWYLDVIAQLPKAEKQLVAMAAN